MEGIRINIKSNEEPKKVVDVEDYTETVNQAPHEATEPQQEVFTEKDAKEAESFIKGFMSFLKGDGFEQAVNDTADKTGLPKKTVAKNFVMKCLGTIGDVVEIGVSMVEDCALTLINVLAMLLTKSVNLLVRVAKRLTRIVTLNQTAKA